MRDALPLGATLLGGAMLLAGCQVAPSFTPRAPLVDESRVYVYLAPLSPALAPLDVELATVAATKSDGQSSLLDLQFTELSPSLVGRERLLAVGTVAPGSYRGLDVTLAGAIYESDQGRSDLLVPETPIEIVVPFDAARGRAVVLSVRLEEEGIVADRYRLVPEFVGVVPEQLTTGLIGIASSRAWSSVTLFDKANGHVHDIVATGEGTSGMALDRERLRAYVANPREDLVQTIDLLSGRVIDRLYMQGGDRPNELVLTADGETLITANAGSNTVSFLDPRSLFETDRIEVDNAPGSLLLDPPQQRVYVFNRLSDTISVLDVPGRRKILTAATDAVPVRGAFDRLGATLFVIHDASPYLRLFEPDLTTRDRIFVGIGATAIAVDPRTGRVYLARRGSGTVDVYDPISLLPIDSIPTTDDVAYLAIDGELNRLAMLERQRGVVRLIKLANRGPVTEIDVGEDPYWVSFVGER